MSSKMIATGLAVVAGSLVLLVSRGWSEEGVGPGRAETRTVASRGTEPRVLLGAGGTISMDLVDANIEDVLKLLSQQAGLNFVAAQAVRDKKVTVYMDRVPIQTAIQSILDANNLTFHRIEHSEVFVVTESGVKPIKVITKVYSLKFARVLPTINESAATFGATGSLIQSGFSGASGGTSGTGSPSGGLSSGGLSSGGLSSSSLGAGSAGGSTTQGIVAIVKQLLTERGTVSTDPRTNSIAVSDVPENFPMIDATIEKLDVRPTQLYLEGEVLEVTLDTLRRLGIEYGDSTGTLATFTGPSKQTTAPLGPRLINYASEPTKTLGKLDLTNLSATLKALATEKDVKFLASPRLMTLSNEVAEIRITADAATGTNSSSQATTGTVSTTVERNTVGTILRVTPLVTDNRYITMVIEPEVSRVIESAKFSSFLDPNRRAARTTVMVEDGQTVMIAGLLSKERELSRRKVPLLGDVPGLSLLFRRTLKTETETEIIVFMTPHIVPIGLSAPKAVAPTAITREQTPISAREQADRRRYRDDLLRQRRMRDTMDVLAQP